MQHVMPQGGENSTMSSVKSLHEASQSGYDGSLRTVGHGLMH